MDYQWGIWCLCATNGWTSNRLFPVSSPWFYMARLQLVLTKIYAFPDLEHNVFMHLFEHLLFEHMLHDGPRRRRPGNVDMGYRNDMR